VSTKAVKGCLAASIKAVEDSLAVTKNTGGDNQAVGGSPATSTRYSSPASC
jgi:hypothetical protein